MTELLGDMSVADFTVHCGTLRVVGCPVHAMKAYGDVAV